MKIDEKLIFRKIAHRNKSWRGNKIAPVYRQTTCASQNVAVNRRVHRFTTTLRLCADPLFAINWHKENISSPPKHKKKSAPKEKE
jgi:hypothetical protein